jgi:hypothetical protein
MNKYLKLTNEIFKNTALIPVIDDEINHIIIKQQFLFISFLYSSIFIFNQSSAETNNFYTLILFSLGFLFIFIGARKKINKRIHMRKDTKLKDISNEISSLLKKEYRFKIISHLSSANDVYSLLFKKLTLKEMVQELILDQKISTFYKEKVILYILKNEEKLTSADVFFLIKFDLNDIVEIDLRVKLLKLKEHAIKIKDDKLSENISGF